MSAKKEKDFKERVWKICLLLFEHNLFPFSTGKISNIGSADTHFLSPSSFLYAGHFCSIAEFDSESRTVIWYPVRASC
jgi:ribulose-5-phosphate 4-epimerase/fuculose-1-phosphate aldolase